MKKKLLICLGIFAALLVVFAIVVALQPADFTIERTAQMDAPPEAVFEQVNDFEHWGNWSPWAKLDPSMKVTYGEKSAGEGATYAWAGNSQVGEGRMTILESKPHELVRVKLEFFKPFPATNEAVFTITPKEEGTHTTWTMTGRNNFPAKAFNLLMDMDALVGGDFEKGLASLEQAAKIEAKTNADK